MGLLVAIIVVLLLGLYIHKRQAPMTVNTCFKGLFVIIASGFLHIDDIKRGAKEEAEEMDVYDIATESK
ncbi:hypothetical protein IM156_11790 [Staphylococcus epidermidis]|nr:hypothetical protein [Staphylococcus epidermidis]